jgi:putative phosphoribosyl transferase
MYFASRLQAGRMLASQISRKYGGQDCAVVALSDGGVVVGAQIALQLHAVVMLLLADQIELPREIIALAGITQDGSFSYNQAFSIGEIDEMVSEYRGLIEQQKLEKLHEMNRSLGRGGLIRQDLLEHRHVILVSDGLSSGFAIDLAIQFLKPVPVKSLVVATPFASVQAVDRMHILADDIFCMNVLEDYISTNHYYDAQDVPGHDVILDTVERVIRDWKPQQNA